MQPLTQRRSTSFLGHDESAYVGAVLEGEKKLLLQRTHQKRFRGLGRQPARAKRPHPREGTHPTAATLLQAALAEGAEAEAVAAAAARAAALYIIAPAPSLGNTISPPTLPSAT